VAGFATGAATVATAGLLAIVMGSGALACAVAGAGAGAADGLLAVVGGAKADVDASAIDGTDLAGSATRLADPAAAQPETATKVTVNGTRSCTGRMP
jgi:hypothetical protein